jgi:hypothetical protein
VRSCAEIRSAFNHFRLTEGLHVLHDFFGLARRSKPPLSCAYGAGNCHRLPLCVLALDIVGWCISNLVALGVLFAWGCFGSAVLIIGRGALTICFDASFPAKFLIGMKGDLAGDLAF